jgi:hypothetical protein
MKIFFSLLKNNAQPDLYKLATETLTYCKKTVPFIPNDFNRNGAFDHLTASQADWDEKIVNLEIAFADLRTTIESVYQSQFQSIEDFKHDNELTLCRVMAKICEKYSFGNCTHISALAYDRLFEWNQDPNLKIDIMSIKKGDHVFVVIGRPIDSDASKPETWKRALGVDGWAGKVFEGEKLEQELYDHVTRDPYTGKSIRQKFDPSYQTIELILTNMYSVQEWDSLIEEKELIHFTIKTLLEKFHSESTSKKKCKIAKEIYNHLSKRTYEQMTMPERMLYSQITAFINKFGAS